MLTFTWKSEPSAWWIISVWGVRPGSLARTVPKSTTSRKVRTLSNKYVLAATLSVGALLLEVAIKMLSVLLPPGPSGFKFRVKR